MSTRMWANAQRDGSPVARAPENVYISAPAQKTAERRAKFAWLRLSDVAAVTKPRREAR